MELDLIKEKAKEAFNELRKTNEQITTTQIGVFLNNNYNIKIPKNKKLKDIFIDLGYEIQQEEGSPLVYIFDKTSSNKQIETANKTVSKEQKSKQLSSDKTKEKLYEFARIYMPTAISYLAKITQQENWGENNYLLQRYLINYFNFIYENPKFPNLNLLSYNEDKSKVCFHTGLFDGFNAPIYAYFEKQANKQYEFKSFCSEGDRYLQDFKLPKSLADNEIFKEKIIFKPDLEVRFNDRHIFERTIRIKSQNIIDKLKSTIIKHILVGELEALKKNHNNEVGSVVPAIYNNEISFFVPLHLTDDNETDAVLAIQREIQPDGKECNVVRTLLPLENRNNSIYQMARTVKRVHVQWLSKTIS